jgi:hypothetical protein
MLTLDTDLAHQTAQVKDFAALLEIPFVVIPPGMHL